MTRFANAKVVGCSPAALAEGGDISSFDKAEYLILPGFCDVHVHFREPGFSYKETIGSGTRAAAHGGVTTVCTMPNLKPVPDCLENLKPQLDRIKQDGVIEVLPYGSITVNEQGEQLADLEGLAPQVVAFSDDGRGVQDSGLMREAMERARALGKLVVAHCEVNELLRGGYIHDGEYARTHGHRGICSESEWREIERDLKLADETGCAFHVCHVSTKESVALIRDAKKSGVDVTCETAPHYLLLDERDLREDGSFKMNPPLRGPDDREAMLEGICDGTVDMIATDHAPHSAQEKSKGLEGSAFGIVGIETAFPLLYRFLVEKGILTLEKLVALMSTVPRSRFSIPDRGDWAVWNIHEEWTISPETMLSMGKATPFMGWTVKGRCLKTIHAGKTVWEDRRISE
ncbi:MAG: dihydroorotase [Oscillospiraceae bacterium]|nr:dihydroorotase [Oscillospiraceae bacterium]